jgi:phosphoribosylamine-glycine ligase
MFVAFASRWGESLSWAARLQDEGHTVKVWIKEIPFKQNGDGLVSKVATWYELILEAKQHAIAGHQVIAFFDFTGMGELADQARKWGIPTVGGGSFMDKLEGDRSFGADFAEEFDMDSPPYQEFGSLDEVIKFAPSLGDVETYLKPDSPDVDKDATSKAKTGELLAKRAAALKKRIGGAGQWVVQQKVEGIALSTARWWNGMKWVGPYEGTIEHKALLNDDLGSATGCSFNAVWFYKESQPEIAKALQWERLAHGFRRHQATPGLYDVNAIVAPGKAWFLEWTPRLGYYSELASMRLMPDLGAHLWAIATGGEPEPPSSDIGYALHVYVAPFPCDNIGTGDKDSAKGKTFPEQESLWVGGFIGTNLKVGEEGWESSSHTGSLGVAYAQSDNLEEAAEEAEDFAMSLRDDVAGVGFRTDGLKVITEDAQKTLDAGFEIPKGLL